MANRIYRNLNVLKGIYQSPKYILLTLAGGVLYYYLFEYLVSLDNYGIVIFYEPIYLVYLLSLTASLLLTVTVYAFSARIRRGAGIVPSKGLVGSISAAVGGCVGGCACQAPILYNIFYLVGLNAFEASGIVTLIASYQIELNVLLILLNAMMTYSILSKVSLTTALVAKDTDNVRRDTASRTNAQLVNIGQLG